MFASDVLKVISVEPQRSNFSFYAASYLSSSEVSRDMTLFFIFCFPISITFLIEFFAVVWQLPLGCIGEHRFFDG